MFLSFHPARDVDYHRWLCDWSVLLICHGWMSRRLSANIRSGTNISRWHVVRFNRKWTSCVLQRDENTHSHTKSAKVRADSKLAIFIQIRTRMDVRCESVPGPALSKAAEEYSSVSQFHLLICSYEEFATRCHTVSSCMSFFKF